MILYLDTSALVKLYVREQGTDDVIRWTTQAESMATSLITLTEANAALARAVRTKNITRQTAEQAANRLRKQWPLFLKAPVTEKTAARAAELAWAHGLRGYDAIHLASAELWQQALELPVKLVTYDNQLAAGAIQLGMDVLPKHPTTE